MSLGRRDFLKAFGAVIAAHAAHPLQAVVLGGETYVNRALGVAFRLPPAWKAVALKDFPALRDEQVVEDGPISDLLLSGSDPFVVLERPEPGRVGRLGASMTAYAEAFEFDGDESLVAAPRLVAGVLSHVLKDYRFVEQREPFRVSGVESVEYVARFRFEAAGVSALARHRSVVALRGGALFTFNVFDYPEEGIDAQADVDRLLGSIAYA